jgi:hypothetical protein
VGTRVLAEDGGVDVILYACCLLGLLFNPEDGGKTKIFHHK